MRFFSQNEKRIIRQLVVESSNSTIYLPINAFNDIFISRDIGFDSTTGMDLVFPYNTTGIPSHEELIAVYNDVLERALLIDYLEKDGLVYLVPASTSVNSLTTIGNVVRLNRISMQIDSSIGEILLKCMNRPLYVSETLKQYVESDFKSLEELSLSESRKQTKYSYWALLLSILAIIISLFQTCGSRTESDEQNVITDTINSSANILLNYMQYNLEPKIEGTMNNTAEIKLGMSDTLVVKCVQACKSKTPTKK